MYSKSRNIVIGFHGCDKKTRDEIVAGRCQMTKSQNDYDWLGNGFYFWENNYDRALQWAKDKMKREPHKIMNPSVLGVFVDLGYCLDLIDSKYLESLPGAYYNRQNQMYVFLIPNVSKNIFSDFRTHHNRSNSQ